MNNFRVKFFKGFYLVMRDKKDVSEKYIFISYKDFCCSTFSFKKFGLNLSSSASFVLMAILEEKRNRKNKDVYEPIDFYKNVCCFLNDGFIPYTGVQYLVLQDANGDLVTSYPLAIYNINQDLIGFADDASELISIWNGDPINAAYGQLEYIDNDFIFKINLV